MFIQTEQTPNPETLKFLPGEPVSPEGPREFRKGETDLGSALGKGVHAFKKGLDGKSTDEDPANPLPKNDEHRLS